MEKVSFKELIDSKSPVLVDFTAAWCGPCKMMAPVLDELKTKVGSKARIIKIDVDKNPSAASAYGVQGVPTFIIFQNGEIKWRQSGVLPLHLLENTLSQFYNQ